jgi:hypothetical protein
VTGLRIVEVFQVTILLLFALYEMFGNCLRAGS